MKKVIFVSVLVLTLVLFAGVVSAAQTSVKIGQVLSDDDSAILDMEDKAVQCLLQQNFCIEPKSSSYTINVFHKNTENSRTFNWLILLLPIWPIMGVTESHTEVIVESNAVNDLGEIVWSSSAKAKDSTIWFSDFLFPGTRKILPIATERSLRGVGSLAYLDSSNVLASSDLVGLQVALFNF